MRGSVRRFVRGSVRRFVEWSVEGLSREVASRGGEGSELPAFFWRRR